VAYGALGTPIQGLASVTGLDPFCWRHGRPQLPFFSADRAVLADLDLRRLQGMKEICPPSWSPASPSRCRSS